MPSGAATQRIARGPRAAGAVDAGCVLATPPETTAGADRGDRLGAVALLELLTAPAPAGIVAADLVLLVDHALLHDRHRRHLFAFVVVGLGAGCARGRRRSGERAAAGGAVPARVGDAPRARRPAA